MSRYSDDELLSLLSEAMSPTPAQPDPTTLARLHSTLAGLSAEVGVLGNGRARRPRRLTGLHGRLARRASVIAAAMVLITGGVATAAVATDTLPGPTRNLAYDMGLPVTSPGLFQARATLLQLKTSIDQRNRGAEVHWGKTLQRDLTDLNDTDLAQIRVPALGLLREIGLKNPLGAPVTTSTTLVPTTTVPATIDLNDGNNTDSNGDGSGPLIPTLTVPNPIGLVPTPDSNGDGGGDHQSSTTTTPTSSGQGSSTAEFIESGVSPALLQ